MHRSGTGYDGGMTTPTNDGRPDDRTETPETGLVPDEELPEDLRPSDDNPLAQDPDESDDTQDADPGGEPKVAGMPDVGAPGAPA